MIWSFVYSEFEIKRRNKVIIIVRNLCKRKLLFFVLRMSKKKVNFFIGIFFLFYVCLLCVEFYLE